MTAHEILSAWNAARMVGGAQFYAEFERLTGFSEAQVKAYFASWTRLTHETAEEVAVANGVTIREGGFQAYLADVKRAGHPSTRAIIDLGYADYEGDPNPRVDKPWPAAEDCPGCDQSVEGPHRFGCTLRGAQQVSVPVTLIPR